MAPSRVAGGLTHSSLSSGIFFQGDGQSQHEVNSHLSSSFGNSSNTIPGSGRSNLGPVSGDVNNAVLTSVANSAPSVGASSLVTDANSALSGGPNMQRSASFDTDSYLRLPASPLSFSSNNISISGSSVMDVSYVMQQNSHQDQNVQQLQQNQQQPLGALSAMPLLPSQTGQLPLAMGTRGSGSFVQDPNPNNLSQLQKKPQLDIKQEDIMQQQVVQQLYQRQDPLQFQGRNPQLQALIQQQQRQKQHQIIPSLPQLQRMHLQQQQQQQQQQMQVRQQIQQEAILQPLSGAKRSFDNGVCARRLTQYLYHQRHRPSDNTIAYWRKFVAEYYSPRAKKRWCLSLYDNVGNHALGVFPQASMEPWQCDICGAKSGRGFEANFEVLPRLNDIKIGSGVMDELLFLELPREGRLSSGLLMLEYGKAVQETVYEQLRVIHEGQLRIVFTQDLKILTWEFCARRHDELLPRRLVAPQVNQLVQVAQKYHNALAESGPDEISQQDLQTNSNMVIAAGRQLAKSLELPSLNDLGFSKRYVRCLQIAEVVNDMKDLMDFSQEHKVGAIESMKNYPRHATAAKLQMQKMQEMEQLANVQGLPTDRNTMAMHPGLNNKINNNHIMGNRGALGGSAQAPLTLANYQNLLMRQNSMNSNPGSAQRNGQPPFNNPNQSPSSSLQGIAAALIPGPMQNSPVSGFSSPRLQQQQYQQQQQHQLQQLQQRSASANNIPQQSHSQDSQGSHQALQHQMILQEMSQNNGGAQQPQSINGLSANGSVPKNGRGFGGQTPPVTGANGNVPGSNGPVPSRSNSFKAAAANSDGSTGGGNNDGFNQRASDMPPQGLHLSDDVVPDISHDFGDNDFFNGDLDDTMDFGWKA